MVSKSSSLYILVCMIMIRGHQQMRSHSQSQRGGYQNGSLLGQLPPLGQMHGAAAFVHLRTTDAGTDCTAGSHRVVVTARRLAAELLWKHGAKAAVPVHALLKLSAQVYFD